MFELVLFLTTLFIAFFLFFKERDLLNPIFLFEALSCLVFFLCYLNLLDYYRLSLFSFLLLFLTAILIPLGGFAASKIRIKNTHCDAVYRNKPADSKSLRQFLFIGLCLFTIVILLIYDIPIIKLLMQGTSYHQMNVEGISTESASGIMVPIMMLVVYPMTYLVSPVCAVEFANHSKHRWILFVLNLLIVLLTIVDHGGRNLLIHFVLAYLLAFLFLKNSSKKRKKTSFKSIIFISLMLLVFVPIFITISSSRGIKDLGESIYLYLTCSVPLFETKLQLLSGNTYGLLSFYGYVVPFATLFRGVGIISDFGSVLSKAIEYKELIETIHPIGGNLSTNAFLPLTFFFYTDFGVFGVIFLSLGYGFFLKVVQRKTKKSPNKMNVSFYILIIIGLLLSFIRFSFTSYNFAIATLYYLFIYKNNLVRNYK